MRGFSSFLPQKKKKKLQKRSSMSFQSSQNIKLKFNVTECLQSGQQKSDRPNTKINEPQLQPKAFSFVRLAVYVIKFSILFTQMYTCGRLILYRCHTLKARLC